MDEQSALQAESVVSQAEQKVASLEDHVPVLRAECLVRVYRYTRSEVLGCLGTSHLFIRCAKQRKLPQRRWIASAASIMN